MKLLRWIVGTIITVAGLTFLLWIVLPRILSLKGSGEWGLMAGYVVGAVCGCGMAVYGLVLIFDPESFTGD